MGAQNSDISKIRLTTELFERAVALAKAYGRVQKNNLPDIRNSSISGSSVILRDSANRQLEQLSLSLLGGDGLGGKSASVQAISARAQAIAWAQSMGYRVPQKPNGFLNAIFIGTGFAIMVVPGVLVAIWLWYLSNQYERDMDTLVARWVDAGRPKPGIKQNIITQTTGQYEVGLDTVNKLQMISSMKEKGLISDSEYEVLRKRELGID